ncbi:MAG: anti-sigma factor antagonist [Chthoniobacteraceae bacterium]|nr:anti-sigma factor antagonist [Chthoniobacteraceae bacterium]
MTTQPSILVGTTDRTVWVRVEGKGSFLNSTGLKEFAKEMINRGFRDFVMDLKNCPVMDSTFMGTLAGIALNLRALGQGQLRATNLNDRNRDLLGNLGLDQLFTIESRPDAPGLEPTQALLPTEGGDDKLRRAQTMLEAHEACVEANPENAAKFKDVLEYLKQDLHLVR